MTDDRLQTIEDDERPAPARPRAGALRFGAFNKDEDHSEALERVKAWTRERFSLDDEAAIMVSEVACTLPGCPPLETVVAFWTDKDARHHFKIFKRVDEVVQDDLPPAWLKDALCATEGSGLECC